MTELEHQPVPRLVESKFPLSTFGRSWADPGIIVLHNALAFVACSGVHSAIYVTPVWRNTARRVYIYSIFVFVRRSRAGIFDTAYSICCLASIWRAPDNDSTSRLSSLNAKAQDGEDSTVKIRQIKKTPQSTELSSTMTVFWAPSHITVVTCSQTVKPRN